MEILFHQYDLIKDGRRVFFDYCASVKQDDFLKDLPAFGDRSMRYLLVHVANTYEFWIGHFAQIRETTFSNAENYKSVNDIRSLFSDVDDIVEKLLRTYAPDQLEMPIANKVPLRDFSITQTPLQLFTHVVTHEYHHKGQVLSMSRQLGYVPVDTDLIRF